MFAYCLNNPVNLVDRIGHNAEAISYGWAASMWWLCGVDGPLPIGEIIYGIGVVVLFAVYLNESSQNSLPATPVDSSITSPPAPPSPNRNDNDDKDNYYDDETNYGGREKVGKSNGKTPRSNRAQNKQFNDVANKHGLSRSQRRILHDKISKKGLDYWELDAIADEMFSKP